MSELIPREPHQLVVCPRCHTNLVRDVGLFRRREMCPPCVVLEGSVASVHNKYISLMALTVGVLTMVIGVIALVIAYLTLRQSNPQTTTNVPTASAGSTSIAPSAPPPGRHSRQRPDMNRQSSLIAHTMQGVH
jgi:hypothetical protein